MINNKGQWCWYCEYNLLWEKFKEKIYNQQRLLTIDIHIK
uniref:Uncharacterized protein n=1 Tax=viral metagenome TaxID=1070528 RepID=A0A6C0H3W4_9ZZZZ